MKRDIKALKTVVYTFNWVPFRVVPRTPKLRNEWNQVQIVYTYGVVC
jgi:hypothetical protein